MPLMSFDIFVRGEVDMIHKLSNVVQWYALVLLAKVDYAIDVVMTR